MTPKYRQKGYMTDPDAGKSFKPKPPPRDRDMFRGRSEGRFKEQVFRCHECNEKVMAFASITEKDTCPKCHLDLHCCKNCSFFNPTAQFECQKEIPERVPKKTKANECPLFSPRIVLDLQSSKASVGTPEDARKAFENLFKKT